MEQKEFKVLLGVTIIGVIVSIGSLVFALAAYQKVGALEQLGKEQPNAAVVDLGPVSFAGFAGKPVSTAVGSSDGMKTIELRGHELKDPKNAYETVSDKDTLTRKIIINSDTKISRVVPNGKKAPTVSEITFDKFTSALTVDTYIASYRAKEGEMITASTPANFLTIFVKQGK